jgi:hypothetical protein
VKKEKNNIPIPSMPVFSLIIKFGRIMANVIAAM